MKTDGIRVTSLAAAAVLLACRPSESPQAMPAPEPTPPPVVVEPEPELPLRLGLILPQTARSDVSEYAVLVREGVDLALDEYLAAGGQPLELLVEDDAGETIAAGRAAAALEAEGAVAIIGPLLSSTFDAAIASRSTEELLILSPTASTTPGGDIHAYSLNAGDTRGATALARWAIQSGLQHLAVLYATTPEDAAAARAFAEAARGFGAQIVAELPFDPGTTTFSGPVERLIAVGAQAVFVPAPERDIPQLAPQFAFFGLTDVQILGTEAWVSDDVLRAVPARVLEGVVVSTPLPEGDRETGWADFVDLYERTYRRTLDNPYPALGYDAARLVLRELAAGRTKPADLAASLAQVRDFRGATGVLSIEDGRVSRQPFLLRVRAGRPELLSPGGT